MILVDPKQDGITHINVYSKGATPLGKFLSNFAPIPVVTEEDGEFLSVEGYWYWLLCDPKPSRDQLRKLYGFQAKNVGRMLSTNKNWPTDGNVEFQNKILYAIKYKILNSAFLEEFKNSTLPFAHYYVFAGKVVDTDRGKWMLEFLESFRTLLRDGEQK
jgi:hypothetical protein